MPDGPAVGGLPRDAEWLEADGLGGFASGTVSGARTRRYHALLLCATSPPTGRVVLVNGVEAWVERDGAIHALTTQQYAPDVRHPDGERRVVAFTWDPWPRWTYRLEDGLEIVHEFLVEHGSPRALLRWSVDPALAIGARLYVRPLLSGRDYHSLHHENPGFRFEAETDGGAVVWCPYTGLPPVVARASGGYRPDPQWYRSFSYAEEADRGLDHLEDLASPGVFELGLDGGEAVLVLEAALDAPPGRPRGGAVGEARRILASEHSRRAAFPTPLHRAGDAYLVARGSGRTIVAGYPWFTDWGRDTFIALRGLCLATGRLDDARRILLEWADAVSEGMLPNRFVDRAGEAPEFNAVDASLWYVIAVHEWLAAARRAGLAVRRSERAALAAAVEAILAGYAQGTRYGIRADKDGLLRAGEPGVQLTWMDAKVGDWVVTPRIGKPVEVQALWLNALAIGARRSARWKALLATGRASFLRRFVGPEGWLHDVVDVDHVAGTVDPSFRPNQILAAGGLPLALLDRRRARVVVDAVEARLLTSLGPRSLAPGDAGYAPRYVGGVRERDGAYHQGTVWPWLLGPFVEAWLRVRGDTDEARREARSRFLGPVFEHLSEAGLGHVSEIADAEPPHLPRGCPFQAWSVAELLRLDLGVLAARTAPRSRPARVRAAR